MNESAPVCIPEESKRTKLFAMEEKAVLATCAVSLLLGIAALAILVILASLYGDAGRIVSFTIYGVSLVTLYTASMVYHSARSKKMKAIFKIIDHSAIYILIAGTYTPFTLISLRGGWGWSLFGAVWALALLGIAFKIMLIKKFKILSTLTYVFMGWLVVIAVVPLAREITLGGISWLLAGGLLYTLGLIFYAWNRLPFNHAIWHLFVLSGSACHFFAVLLYVLPS